MMKKKLLLFVVMLTGLTSVWAQDNGTLTVANIRNAVPGYRGSLDIVLTSDNLYAGYQFDIKLPTGLTYDGYADGPLIDGHIATVSDQGNNTRRFTGAANEPTYFTAKTGTLLTIYFIVDDNASGTLPGGLLSDIHFSNFTGSTDYALSETPFSVTIGSTVTLSEDETAAPSAKSGVDVVIERSLKAGVWNTICLPFAMNSTQITSAFGSDAQIADFTGVDVEGAYDADLGYYVTSGIKVNFTSVTEMEAHHPYIIKVSSPKSEFSVSSVTITTGEPTINRGNATNYKKIVGTYSTETTIPDGGLYLMDNKFKYSQGTSKLKAFRAYFDFFNKLEGYKTASAPAITLDVDGISTGISSATLDDKAGMTNEKYYTVQGLQVSQPKRGLYIVNGKKMIVK